MTGKREERPDRSRIEAGSPRDRRPTAADSGASRRSGRPRGSALSPAVQHGAHDEGHEHGEQQHDGKEVQARARLPVASLITPMPYGPK